MSNENKRRKPVFQEQGSAHPVETDPPFQASVLGDDVIAPDTIAADDEVTGLGEPETPLPPEPEAADAPDDLPSGWELLGEAQQDGRSYVVTHDLVVEGRLAFWRKTRVLSHFRWVFRGKWSDSLTREDIAPPPVYYKRAS